MRTPLAAAAAAAAAAASAAAPPGICGGGNTRNQTCYNQPKQGHGTLLRNFTTKASPECCAACDAEAACAAWMWNYASREPRFNPSMCWLLKSPPDVKPNQPNCDIGARPATPAPPPPPAPAGARNVLYILVDDLRTQLGAYGHSEMHTPHIDAFAQSGSTLVFEQAHCNSAMCVPTRNSFMTGRRPATTLVFNAGVGVDNFRITGPDWTTMPQHFKDSGYYVTGVGKTFHPNKPPNNDQPASWSDEYYYPKPVSCDGTDVWCSVTGNATFEDILSLREAQRRLSAAAAKPYPFFVAVGFHKPHTPYRAPAAFYDLYPPAAEIALPAFPEFPDTQASGLAWFSCQAEGKEYPINHSQPYPDATTRLLRRAYYAATSFTDDNIGQLLGTLADLGRDKDTVVALHGDHGYQLGERNVWCKETNYQLATHVPLIIRAPQYAFAAARTAAFVELVDVFPTLAALAGVPPLDPSRRGEPALEGASLEPLFAEERQRQLRAGGGAGAPRAAAFNASYSQYGRNRCTSNLFENGPNHECASKVAQTYMGYTVRTAAYRYTRWVNITAAPPCPPAWDAVAGEELYAHAKSTSTDDFDDPAETVNVAAEPAHAAALAQHRTLLRAQFDPASSKG